MANIRVTRFSRNTRFSVLVPNEQSRKLRVVKRVVRTTKKQGHIVQLPLPWLK